MAAPQQDRILRATSDSGRFRLVLVDATRAADHIAARHEARGYAAQLLGEAVASSLLLASGLKGPGTVQLRFSLSGDISRVHADATPFGLVRAMIPRSEILRTGSFEPMVLPRMLRVIKLDAGGARLSEGVVEMVAADISASMSHYLRQSEQGTFLLRVAAGFDEAAARLRFAGGILIEAFPGAAAADWRVLDALVGALEFAAHAPPAAEGLDLDRIADSVAASFPLQVHREFGVEPYCPCSEQGVLRALAGLGRAELESMHAEGNDVELFCEFCRTRYLVPPERIRELAEESPPDEPAAPEFPADPEPPQD